MGKLDDYDSVSYTPASGHALNFALMQPSSLLQGKRVQTGQLAAPHDAGNDDDNVALSLVRLNTSIAPARDGPCTADAAQYALDRWNRNLNTPSTPTSPKSPPSRLVANQRPAPCMNQQQIADTAPTDPPNAAPQDDALATFPASSCATNAAPPHQHDQQPRAPGPHPPPPQQPAPPQQSVPESPVACTRSPSRLPPIALILPAHFPRPPGHSVPPPLDRPPSSTAAAVLGDAAERLRSYFSAFPQRRLLNGHALDHAPSAWPTANPWHAISPSIPPISTLQSNPTPPAADPQIAQRAMQMRFQVNPGMHVRSRSSASATGYAHVTQQPLRRSRTPPGTAAPLRLQGSASSSQSSGSLARSTSSQQLSGTASSSSSSASSSASASAPMSFRNFAIQLGARATNLTSTQHGTAASDKRHIAAVLRDACLVATLDAIDAFPEYRQTLNNKLKALKVMEFLHERLAYHLVGGRPVAFDTWPRGAELCGVLRIPDSRATRENAALQPPYRIVRRGRSLNVCVFRAGQRIFPAPGAEDEDARFWATGPTRDAPAALHWLKFDLRPDDLVFVCRGYAGRDRDALDQLQAMARAVRLAGPVGDYDRVLPAQGHTRHGDETGCLVARVGSDFDAPIEAACALRLRHVLHWERCGEPSAEPPWPYAITKHSVLHRPYLAMLYLDASKINRFHPTIDFLVRKVRGCAPGAPVPPLLAKLSDIQHMAGVMLVRGCSARLWATSGAVPVLIRQQRFTVYGEEGWAIEGFDVPLTELDALPGDLVLLLSPTVKAVWELDALKALLRRFLLRPLDAHALRHGLLSELARKLPEEGNAKHGIALFELIDAPCEVLPS